jgi:hypothetical protein
MHSRLLAVLALLLAAAAVGVAGAAVTARSGDDGLIAFASVR